MTVSVDKPIICPVLIGRTPELTSLRALLEQVKGGHGQVVMISGEAGIGKSRLIMETRGHCNGRGFPGFCREAVSPQIGAARMPRCSTSCALSWQPMSERASSLIWVRSLPLSFPCSLISSPNPQSVYCFPARCRAGEAPPLCRSDPCLHQPGRHLSSPARDRGPALE